MIKVGINGFGRIGKCIFVQLMQQQHKICAINAPNLAHINKLNDYVNYDIIHKYDKLKVDISTINMMSDRDANNLNWDDCDYIIDATGKHNNKVLNKNKRVIITSPAKDNNTSTYIYGTNHLTYNGESIVSASSCTTNCIAPVLKILNDKFNILHANFTTIHATTASQKPLDVFNNIIPYTTGASKSIYSVLPELKGLIHGTSVRIPVSNVSLIDLNIAFSKNVTLENIESIIKQSEYYGSVFHINDKKLVSSNFITTSTPSIIDMNMSFVTGTNTFKLFIWYDNEWSYSAQVIRLMEHMHKEKMIDTNMNHKRKE